MAQPRKNELPPLTDAQLEIMHVVWEREVATVSDVWHVLAGRREVARNTVLTLMERMEKKGWLTRSMDGQTHIYVAAVSKEKTLGDVVRGVVDKAFAGSAEKLVLALLDGRGLTDEEADRIRELIQQTRKKKDKA